MPTVNCLGCSREIQFADSEAGQRFECAGCGAVVTAEASQPTEFDVPPMRTSAAHFRTAPYFSDSEPWYYRFLSTYANVVMWLAISAVALTLAVLIASTILGFGFSRDPGYLCAGLLTLAALAVYLGLLLVSVLLYVAYILLAVDIGRNVREMRQIMQRRGG